MTNQQIYDDIDYGIMQDLTRMGENGLLPAELVAADTWAHEFITQLNDNIEVTL